MAAWHSLISDALVNMTGEEPVDSPRSQALAERYLRLQAEEALRPVGEGFVLREKLTGTPAPGRGLVRRHAPQRERLPRAPRCLLSGAAPRVATPRAGGFQNV